MNVKKTYLELLRIIACPLVIFNHLRAYYLYGSTTGMKQVFYMFLTMFTRINVPIFLMISGTLLLEKTEDFKQVFKKRISRIVIVLLVFEIILYAITPYDEWLAGAESSHIVIDFIRKFMDNSIPYTGAYWYVYAYLTFLFVLPFMQRAVKGIDRFEFVAIIVIHGMMWSLLPMMNLLLSRHHIMEITISSDLEVPLAYSKALFYPLVGYYIDHEVDVHKFKVIHLISIAALALSGIFLSGYCTYIEGTTTGTYTQNFVQLFDYVTAIAVFLIIKYILTCGFPSINEKLIAKMICFCGSLTFGIYLFDPVLKRLFYHRYTAIVKPIWPTICVSLGWIVISILVGGTITAVLKRIPYIKRYL